MDTDGPARPDGADDIAAAPGPAAPDADEGANDEDTGSQRADDEGADEQGTGGKGAGSQVSVGLVLSAGGNAAEAWHAGVIRALEDATGWDARRAELILGTSAGAITGLCLRAGIPPADLYARLRGEPVSDEGQALIDRVVTPYTEGHSERDWAEHRPQSPTMTARALWPLGQVRPLHAAVGLLPRGTRTTEALEQRMAELHPEPWPARRFWAAAVRLSDGERVVFGRDDVETTAAEAVRASCAVPIRYEPVTVDGRRYVDGGVHSYTNADLMGPPAFDVVIVSSPMSGPPGWPEVRGGLSKAWTSTLAGLGLGQEREAAAADNDRTWWSEALDQAWLEGRALRAARRQWVDDKLREEVAGLTRRGTVVLVVEPDADAVELMDAGVGDNFDHDASHDESDDDRGDPETRRSEIAALADRTTRRLLAGPGGRRLAALLRRASS